jgi:hypothetical protein
VKEGKTYGIYFSRRCGSLESYLILNGRNKSFVHSIKYLGEIFDKKITWRLYIVIDDENVFGTLIIVHCVFKIFKMSDEALTLNRPSRKHSLGS